ncbi:hypothetical protein [Pelagibius marinus]|uniref:hypothetical protein n=1 Tax=Pelagibius marinus TaxID=2762760 RepID=UPI0018726F65|nr:hypothetical protein [Pelagibius marinus]
MAKGNKKPQATPGIDQSPPAPGFPWGAFLLMAIYGIGSFAIFGFLAVLIYGVAVIVFRVAFGIELPNPFS